MSPNVSPIPRIVVVYYRCFANPRPVRCAEGIEESAVQVLANFACFPCYSFIHIVVITTSDYVFGYYQGMIALYAKHSPVVVAEGDYVSYSYIRCR